MNEPHGLIHSALELVSDKTFDDKSCIDRVLQLICDEKPTWNWIGVYLLCGQTLVLGPYIGKHTDHTRIEVGVGVCGTAVATHQNIIVSDVRKLTNYLACSLETRSELVVLIKHNGIIVGQFDIDSDEVGAFTPADEAFLEELAEIVANRCYRLSMRLGVYSAS